MLGFIDTHAHLDFPEFDQDRADVLKKSKEAGLLYVINTGASVERSRKSVRLADEYDCVYATAGVHPHEADSWEGSEIPQLKALASHKKVLAIGEIGVDYFKNFSQPDNQKKMFLSLLDLAIELNLPVVVHCRNAFSDTLRILKEKKPVKTVFHCFSGDSFLLKECLELGFYLSFTCNITYKKTEILQEVVRVAPLDRIMLETDAPYLSPQEARGLRNEPVNVLAVARKIAEIKSIALEQVIEATTRNAKKFFSLP